MLGALLPDILQSEVVNYEGERDGAGRVRSDARGVFGGSVSVGVRTDVSLAWVRTPAWGRPYIPFRVSNKTQPSGVTNCCKLYACMNYSGI